MIAERDHEGKRRGQIAPDQDNGGVVGGKERHLREVNVPCPEAPRASRTWPWVAVTLALLGIVLLSVPLDRVVEALAWIGPGPTLLAVVVCVVDGTLVDADRLRRVCRHLGLDMSLCEAAGLAIPATAFGIVAPFQVDEVLKARQLNMQHGRPFAEALGIVATERGFSLVAHASLLAGGLSGLWRGPPGASECLLVALGTAFSGAVLLLLARALASWRTVADHRLFGAVAGPYRRLSPGFIVAMFAYALGVDLSVVATLQVMANAAGLDVPFAALLVLRHGSVLLAKVPVTVGGYGLREGSLALGLAAYGEAPAAVAVALWFGVCANLVPSLVALLFRPFVARSVERLREDLALGLREVWVLLASRDKRTSDSGPDGEVKPPC